MKRLNSEVNQVAQALENCRHNLPIVGVTVDDIEPVFRQNLPKLSRMAEKAEKNEKKEFLEGLETLLSSVEMSAESSKNCAKSLKELKSEALNEASMKLSLLQAAQNEDIEDLLVIPPEPKLIEF